MAIQVQEIVNRSLSALDAEGSDRYTFDQDFKYAIRNSVEWIVGVINQAFAQKKMSGEALRELVKVNIWQANNFSRIAFDPSKAGYNLWSILAIYPKPTVFPFRAPIANADKALSIFQPDLTYVSGTTGAKRMTLEEWNENANNVFMPGNNQIVGALADYAYLDFGDYSSTSYNNPGSTEIEIRPSVANSFVALAVLKQPTVVTAITDSLEFPQSMTDIIVEKTLNFIATKQGNGTTLYGITERDVQRLVSILV